MTDRKHVVVFYTVAGGGHVAAANALKEILEGTGGYRVTLVNPYVELVADLDLWQRFTGRTGEEIYNESIIRDGKTGLYCLGFYAGGILNLRLTHRAAQRRVAAWLEEQKPDLVISVIPLSNRIVFDALNDYRRQSPGRAAVPGVVLITDWTEYGRHIWFPRGADYFAICGTGEAYRRANRYPSLSGRVFRTQGLLLKPSFQGGPPEDKAAAKAALGLTPDKPVICMLYGAHGGWRMRDMALALKDLAPDAQVLFLCGHNQDLATALAATDWPFPTQVVGFTREVPRYLGASDLFIGKPGPGGVSEALSYGLSLLLDRTMGLPQEAPVVQWVERTGAGASFRGPREFLDRVHRLLTQLTQGINPPKPHPNTASLEIPGIIGAILEWGEGHGGVTA
ncbi:glycosyltransferase family protein [Pararhodospirillum oryzae]|uniref:Uncharacterized protein n=1 Tax=Pararhodospirillum oryzae TaxID=478448 RepID=A0A512H523_9PROT|nr:hypothetical protein [Pararhodospirillum oryzae]GEO80575.1 hypothetical protein ROR02_07060 [Pararhodospirillum oryzae]